jgi:predicted Fe-Mo cluster-binding NifX family protein
VKICITSSGDNLNSNVDPRFGRCEKFIIIDTETMDYKVIENQNATNAGGAGIQSSQLVASEGVTAVITGNVGPNAYQTLKALNLRIFVGASGTVEQAIEKFKLGKLEEVENPSVAGHFGKANKGFR